MPTKAFSVDYTLEGEPIKQTLTIEADSIDEFSGEVADSETDKQITRSILYAALQLLIISSDQDVQIETNSGSAADDTLTITAGKPLVWYAGCGLDNPLTANVTALFVTNASGAAATLKMVVAQNSISS